MSENGPAEMPPELVQFLLGGRALVVATVDEQGAPVTSLMTWAVARNPLTVALAVDLRNRSLRNIRMNPKVAIEELRDHAAAGIRFTGPRYRFQPGKEHRKGVEEAVYEELKGPAPTI